MFGGVILGDAEFIENKLHDYLKHTGPALSPFNAWIMMKGLETLSLRTDRQIESAKKIADYLVDLAKIKEVVIQVTNPIQSNIAQKQMTGAVLLLHSKLMVVKKKLLISLINLTL